MSNTTLDADDLINQAISTLSASTELFEQRQDDEGSRVLALAQFTATMAVAALLQDLLHGPTQPTPKLRSV